MATYQFGNLIGSGGFGEVFEAIRVEDSWKCAAKRLKKDVAQECRTRFLREVRMQAPLRHPNIVRIIGYNLNDEQPWYIMPRALMNLRDYLQGGFVEGRSSLFRQIAEGLQYAHHNNVIHRDLKPENVLLFMEDEALRVRLGDFGIGRFASRDTPPITESYSRMGTREYMAPEQYRNPKDVDRRADIFSLGKIFYEILTGRIPYPELDYTDVPPKYRYIIQKSCQNNPENRYQNVSEVMEDLDIVVTRLDKPLTRVSESIREEIQSILVDLDFGRDRVEHIVKLLLENTDDNEVLTGILPVLPDQILKVILEHFDEAMVPVIHAYDDAVSGTLPFSYCDTVADFYEKVFRWSESLDLKQIVLERLPILGFSHNRWHVGKVFAKVVSELEDPSLILAVRDILKKDSTLAAWCRVYLENHSLAKEIRDLIAG